MIARLAFASFASLALTGAALAAEPSAGTATATAPAPAPATAKPDAFPLHATASLTHSAGTGTFVVAGWADPTIQSLATLAGTARINDQWSASTEMRIGFEWTQSDGDTVAHQLELADPRFAVGYNAWSNKDLGLKAALSGGYLLPISMASRAVGSTGVFSLGGRASWDLPMVSGLSLYGLAGVGYAYNDAGLRDRYAQAAAEKGFTASDGQNEAALTCAEGVRAGSADIANGACAGTGKGFRWNVGIGGAYSFLDDKLSVAVDVSYLQAFNSYQPSDSGVDNLGFANNDLASKNARGAFDLAQGQATIGSIGVSYTPVKWFTVSGGLYTFQPVITPGPSGNVVRWFPLWDVYSIPGIGTSATNNFSSLFIDTTFQI